MLSFLLSILWGLVGGVIGSLIMFRVQEGAYPWVGCLECPAMYWENPAHGLHCSRRCGHGGDHKHAPTGTTWTDEEDE